MLGWKLEGQRIRASFHAEHIISEIMHHFHVIHHVFKVQFESSTTQPINILNDDVIQDSSQ